MLADARCYVLIYPLLRLYNWCYVLLTLDTILTIFNPGYDVVVLWLATILIVVTFS